MAVPNNTVETFDRIGIREDLADVIYNIAPTETPFMSNAATGTAAQTLHEWQTDGLAAAANPCFISIHLTFFRNLEASL